MGIGCEVREWKYYLVWKLMAQPKQHHHCSFWLFAPTKNNMFNFFFLIIIFLLRSFTFVCLTQFLSHHLCILLLLCLLMCNKMNNSRHFNALAMFLHFQRSNPSQHFKNVCLCWCQIKRRALHSIKLVNSLYKLPTQFLDV